MKTEHPKILGSREQSSKVSTWTEYLRLNKPGKNSALLEICMYEALGEQTRDEEGEPLEPPAEIGGKKVVGVDDGIIIGGDLTCWKHEYSFSFTRDTLPDAIGWLGAQGWKGSDKFLPELAKAVGGKSSAASGSSKVGRRGTKQLRKRKS
jgi:hypothetical protein